MLCKYVYPERSSLEEHNRYKNLNVEDMIRGGTHKGNCFNITRQGLSQDLETGCPKLAIVKSLGVQKFNGDHNTLRFQQ